MIFSEDVSRKLGKKKKARARMRYISPSVISRIDYRNCNLCLCVFEQQFFKNPSVEKFPIAQPTVTMETSAMGHVHICHSSHHFATQSSHLVDRR